MPLAHETAIARLQMIARTIEAVEARCLAAGVPATNIRHEMTDEELFRIYRWASSAQPKKLKRKSK